MAADQQQQQGYPGQWGNEDIGKGGLSSPSDPHWERFEEGGRGTERRHRPEPEPAAAVDVGRAVARLGSSDSAAASGRPADRHGSLGEQHGRREQQHTTGPADRDEWRGTSHRLLGGSLSPEEGGRRTTGPPAEGGHSSGGGLPPHTPAAAVVDTDGKSVGSAAAVGLDSMAPAEDAESAGRQRRDLDATLFSIKYATGRPPLF